MLVAFEELLSSGLRGTWLTAALLHVSFKYQYILGATCVILVEKYP